MHKTGLTESTFGEVPFRIANAEQAVRETLECIAHDPPGADIHLLNAYSLALSTRDPEYASCIKSASMNFPDGKPISLVSRLLGGELSQVRGPDYFEKVIQSGLALGLRHFMLGSTPETLDRLRNSICLRYPGVEIVGLYSPPFRSLTSTEMEAQDDLIRKTNPDIVWVGLGTPKQDFEAQRLARRGFNAAAVGAAFDYSAGTLRPAPKWVRSAGFEWCYRLAAEPKRLWKRYLWGNTIFLAIASREAFLSCARVMRSR